MTHKLHKNGLILLTITLLTALLLAACGDSPTTTAAVRATNTTIVQTTQSTAPTTITTEKTLPLTTPTVSSSALPATTAIPSQPKLTTVPATVKKADGQTVAMNIELARTGKEQEFGLMGRTKLDADSGMLFIFQSLGTPGFWMKNTLLPLSIAFISKDGKIQEIRDMQPLSEQVTTPAQPYLYALEVEQGYFTKKGIKAGDVIEFKLP